MSLFGKKEREIIDAQEATIQSLNKKLEDLGYSEFTQVKEAIDSGKKEIEKNNAIIGQLSSRIETLSADASKLEKQANSAQNKLKRSRELYKSIEYSITEFNNPYSDGRVPLLTPEDRTSLDELAPSVILKLHAMDMNSLRKAFRENDKQIEKVMTQYAARYTTKANQTIYKLMVIALRAELQNVLYNLKYEKLDTAVEQIKTITSKYLSIASEGNQNIVGTLTKFIGEIEYLFINAVKIEYNYYVKKEQAKQEQAAIREQMKQEAAERKALELEKKRIEAEESKYKNEVERIQQQLATASAEEAAALSKRVLDLEAMLSDVLIKKEEIVNLQNGKAGNIYIISNLGSFGENMFKIGMTRRLNPQDRIDELGSASVPFKFDVHSFIFSEDAVSLETKLHQTLNDKRVNKVNLRKEFFYSSVDELEALVNEIDPSAEFTKTMLAEEFRQSQSSDVVYTSDSFFDEDE